MIPRICQILMRPAVHKERGIGETPPGGGEKDPSPEYYH